jgi:hypothetical protein
MTNPTPVGPEPVDIERLRAGLHTAWLENSGDVHVDDMLAALTELAARREADRRLRSLLTDETHCSECDDAARTEAIAFVLDALPSTPH